MIYGSSLALEDASEAQFIYQPFGQLHDTCDPTWNLHCPHDTVLGKIPVGNASDNHWQRSRSPFTMTAPATSSKATSHQAVVPESVNFPI